MRPIYCSWIHRAAILLVFTTGAMGMLLGQTGYHVTHYTSKQGLPQNSVRGLAFDQHGFLWLATEGGIARFDGQLFVTIGEEVHAGIRNQRFTHLLPYTDTSMLFIDHLNGMYTLSNDRFSTYRQPDANYPGLIRLHGFLPGPSFIFRDSFFLEEAKRAKATNQLTIVILPVDDHKIILISDRIVLLDLVQRQRKVLSHQRGKKEQFAKLGKSLLKIGADEQLTLLRTDGQPFEPCKLTNENGSAWEGSLSGATLFSQYPFEHVFLTAGEKLYSIEPGKDQNHFILRLVLDVLPANCTINAIAYRKSEDMLVLGTDSRGFFAYQKKNFHTYIPDAEKQKRNDAYYAQCLYDATTLMTGNGLLFDLQTMQVKNTFPKPINDILLATDDRGRIYYTQGRNLFRYTPLSGKEDLISAPNAVATHCITWLDSSIWIGTTTGVGRIVHDTIQWVHTITSLSDQYGIKTITQDQNGDLWFGSYFQLYRFNPITAQLDSFPGLANLDIRILTMIRNKLFIGTYGNGYFIFHDGRFTHMPQGRFNELSNAHTFIEDKDGYLWMSTNRGLYKTHLDAVDAFLKDTTLLLDYYAYLEEDGIFNTEFNGGCSPTHLKLPDGRYSLPSLEGLVVFNPHETPHYFSKDSVVIEYIEVDGQKYRPENLDAIPASHSNIRVHYSSAWWNVPNNQYVYLGMEGSEERLRLSELNQKAYSLGHLKSGKHTFLIRRRCGFGAEDFILSQLHFTVKKPWYGRGWVITLFILGLVMVTWGTSVLYARSIRQRNTLLRRKVDEQTKELLASNVQLEENVNKLAKTEIHLRKNIQVRDRLISIITHDILTPLRFIGQIARLGAEEKQTDAGLTRRALSDVQNAVHKLFHSTQNLLHWVTYHQEQFKTSTINCSPFALVEQLMEDFSEMSRFQGNRLINDVPEDDVILTDPRILTIILHNLLSNAIKYTQRGEITVRSRIEHKWYILEVSDTGRGMTTAQLEAVHMGTTSHGEISVEDLTAGNGIGLSLVADLVQALNARWEIDSPQGAGVYVRIFISLDNREEV
jgi:signal transduction histidine kinase